MKPTIYFRVDGDDGKKIGLGHVTRCFKIYKELKKNLKLKYNFVFLMKNYHEGKLFIKSQIRERIIEFNKKNLEKITFKKNDVIIVDTLGLEKKLLNYLKKKNLKKIISLDDLKMRIKNTTIINGIFFSKKKLKSKKNFTIFQSPKYIALDKKFMQKKYFTPVSKKINFIVSSGGGDKRNFMFHICKVLDEIKNIKVFLIIGKAVKKNNLVFRYINNKKFNFIKNKDNIYNYLSKSNIAIVSGGTVMFESICSGIKTLVAKTYENQKYAIKYFEKKGLIINLGNYRNLKKRCIVNEINKIEFKQKKEKKIFHRCTNEIDGKGLFRIIKIVKNILNE